MEPIDTAETVRTQPIPTTTLSHAPFLSDAVRRQHAAFITGDTRFASVARLLASLWRVEQNLPASIHVEQGSGGKAGKTRKLRAGWRLRREDALAGRTFLTPEIAAYVRRVLILREPGAMWDEAKILGHLLSSQGLALNLFAPMALDLELATRVWSRLLPNFVLSVTHLKFETSPGRGDDRYLHDGTAWDIQLDVITPDGELAFIAIELKFIEQMIGPSASVRPHYGEVARASGLYCSPDDPLLYRPGIEQLRREHTLAQLMVDQGHASRGLFVLTGPSLNLRVAASAKVYADTLVAPLGATPDRVGFVHLTLETILDALAHAGAADHARAVHARYLDFERVAAVALGYVPLAPRPPVPPSSPLALPSPRPSAASSAASVNAGDAPAVNPAQATEPVPTASPTQTQGCRSSLRRSRQRTPLPSAAPAARRRSRPTSKAISNTSPGGNS
ncbi:hypothetical protein [Methylobacterium sp. WL8]|uniref:PGN_0703 family putative restriction endonuclease n=1 Tax=Methylobacterium sp. WL8 TaxID=2603899 RepID=UPI0011C7D129|nr:hypothetical protein [Methylobacterium sp. WL8]TXN77958.1 hypothetical protein FV234_23230 [Methylobacterium sp. WL8]